MLTIDLNYAKFFYKMVLLTDLKCINETLKNMGMIDIGYPEEFKLERV